MRLLLCLLLLLIPGLAQAQLWSSVLNSSRATDWTQAGVPGGIPARTTQCGSTIAAYTGTAATINNALQNCSGSGQFVQLGAGTFHLSSGINFNNGNNGGTAQNVTLRGAGPNSTTISAEGAFAGCGYGGAGVICMNDKGWGGGWPNAVNWTAGYTAGTTQITLSSTAGMVPNTVIWLDQLDAPVGDFTNYVPFPTQNATYTNTAQCEQQVNRCVYEVHYVVSKVGNVVTIAPPLAYHAWNAHGNDTPQARFYTTTADVPYLDGVENLTVTNASSSGVEYGLVQIQGALQSWVKNVRGINAVNAHVYVKYSSNIEIRDSYWFGQTNPSGCLIAAQQYGIDTESASFVKVENNILQKICTALMIHSCSACVVGYNLTVGDLTVGNQGTNFGWASFLGHSGGTHSTLFEGNISNAFSPDHNVAHGTNAGFHVAFRNYFSGQQVAGSTVYGYPGHHQGYNRMSSWIGNVLGNPASSAWFYQSVPGSYHSLAIWSIGMGCGESASGTCGIPDDAITTSSTMRWGNYDYSTGTSRFQSSEVPSPGTAPYLQSVPSSQVLPSSFYLSAKPSWFGNLTYPVIGPDVTGGYDTSGHVNSNPARNCYSAIMGGPANGSGSVRAFDATTCYGGGADTTPPAAPTGVQISRLQRR